MDFFPDLERQADIQFHFCKQLPYMLRMKFIALCMGGGLLVQILFHFWAGLFVLGIGMALSLIKGYSDNPTLTGKEEWNQVTPDEFRKVKAKQEQLKQWDIDAFDITNPLGAAIAAVVAGGVWAVWIFFNARGYGRMAGYWFWDAVVILAPHWITGVRTFLKRDQLITKINYLGKVMGTLSAPSDIQVLPMLSTRAAKEGGRVPVDARLLVRFLNAPEYFLGMQIQISVNSVQGKDYPYLYCVIIAKKEAQFFSKKPAIVTSPPRDVVFEKTRSDDVDVLVIRQHTTQTSGYHTSVRQQTIS